MSTKGAWGFIRNGKEKITYNHSDSYPSGLGVTILEFVAETPIERMIEVADEIILVSNEKRPTPEQIEQCRKWLDEGVSERRPEDWYCLLRGSQGEPKAYLEDGLRYMIDNHTFLEDSLFCEWAYLINPDTKRLEVYKGYNRNPEAPGRYAHKQAKDDSKYWGVILIDEVPIDLIKKMKAGDIEERLKRWKGMD
jgi:hypothetical protein